VRRSVDILLHQWNDSGDRLLRRIEGITDSEFFWEPVSPCWTVRRDGSAPSGHQIDYDDPAPDPAPFTTIAWRLIHLANGNLMYWEYAFGSGTLMFPDLEIPGTADDARQYWLDSREPVTGWLETAHDDDLREPRPSHLGEPRPVGGVVLILIDEQVHHGAEIALLRDLYRLRHQVR
jgi:hypothetical protein